jgi:RND family efflux transporter MFP subunit
MTCFRFSLRWLQAFCIFAISLLLTGCSGESSPSAIEQTGARVRVVTVNDALPAGRRYTGEVRARTESNLGFRVNGKIAQRLVDPGQQVRRGQVLLRLDDTDLKLSTTQAQAAVEARRVQYVRAAADEKRLRALVQNGAVSRQAYDQVQANANAAQAELTAARAQARQAANQAQYADLRADADGVILQTTGEPGQVVNAGQIVAALAHDGPREAAVDFPENAVLTARKTATATLYTQPDLLFDATLRELSAVADTASRSYRARYTLSGDGSRAPLGATVTLAMQNLDADAVLQVPIGALLDRGTGPGVWRVDGNSQRVRWHPVTVRQVGEAQVLIAMGGAIQPGDTIVALGAHLLHDDQRVAPLINAVRRTQP